MMLRARGLRAIWAGAIVCSVVLFSGCARTPVLLEEEATRTEIEVASVPVAPPEVAVSEEPALATSALQVREIKVISDNGQQGIFAKLTRVPRSVTHFTLVSPNRLVVELESGGPLSPIEGVYPVDDPVVREVRVGTHEDKMRITIGLADGPFPTYTVDDLNDTLVAFLGEPQGTSERIREQVVFTQRAVPGVPKPPARVVSAPPPAAAVTTVPPPAPVVSVPPPPVVSAPAPPPAPVVTAAQPLPVINVPAPIMAAAEPVEVAAPPEPAYQPPPPPRPVRRQIFSQPTLNTMGESGEKLYFGQPISLDLKDADIHNVLRMLAEVSKLNVVATDDVEGTITLRLFDVPWDQALDLVLHVMGLSGTQEGNVLRISTVKRLREEQEELAKQEQAQEQVERLRVAYVHVNYAKAKKMAELVSGAARVQASSRGRGDSGGGGEEEGILTSRGSVMVDEFTNTLVVRDIATGIRNAYELVERLDVPIPQVLIESNIVEATTNFARDLGVQWGYQASVGPQTGNLTGLNFPGSIGLGGSGLNSGSGSVPFIADFPAAGNFGAGSGAALDLSLGSLDGSSSLDLRLTALEEEGKARIISRPRVMTLNNVSATIRSLTVIRVRLPDSGTTVSTGGGSVSGGDTATEKIETGIILTVTPQVSADGFVLLDMFVKSSQADFAQTVDNIPTEITREANGHVLVRDGQTVVLGGIYRDQLSDGTQGVPFLNDLPGLSWLFRSESNKSSREDLLVFLTPRIVVGAEQYEQLPEAEELWEQREDQG